MDLPVKVVVTLPKKLCLSRGEYKRTKKRRISLLIGGEPTWSYSGRNALSVLSLQCPAMGLWPKQPDLANTNDLMCPCLDTANVSRQLLCCVHFRQASSIVQPVKTNCENC